MSVARRRCPGERCDLHPTSATKLSSILDYDHWGGTSPLHHPYTLAYTLIGARQYRPFSEVRLLLRRHPHQSSTRPHTCLHRRPTHSPLKEFRLHSLNHLQEFRLKLLTPFQEFRLDSRLRACGPRILRTSRLPQSRVPWFDTTYHR